MTAQARFIIHFILDPFFKITCEIDLGYVRAIPRSLGILNRQAIEKTRVVHLIFYVH